MPPTDLPPVKKNIFFLFCAIIKESVDSLKLKFVYIQQFEHSLKGYFLNKIKYVLFYKLFSAKKKSLYQILAAANIRFKLE